jgi:alpha-L-fucosidase
MRLTLISFFSILSILKGIGQDPYVVPKDTLVRQKLAHWKDLKFGLLMHWGTYSQWGIVESWSLCNEDEDWCKRKGPYANNFDLYRRKYEELKFSFNPTAFDPSKWALAAKDAGMKYVVFTTKHHDGFCMFDTQHTDYKMTSPDCPAGFDATEAITKAFRENDFFIGLYFSKPDWHCQDYWWPYFATPDRNVNYNPEKYPEKWKAYKQFTYNQIQELTSQYGPIDLLWLDGGWVRPKQQKNPSWVNSPYNQDIDMASIAKMARANQPGLLIVDRSVGGEFENYWTPEQHIPPQEEKLDYPWETCMTMANSWSYVPNDQYKSSTEILKNLATIVSRGGNYLLNIAPSPTGEWDNQAYVNLKEIGQWMKVNGEAIYGTTRHSLTTQSDNYYYTQKGDTVYCIYFKKEGQDFPTYFPIEYPRKPESEVRILGMDEPVSYEWKNGMNWKVKNLNKSALANQPAVVFYFKWQLPASSK